MSIVYFDVALKFKVRVLYVPPNYNILFLLIFTFFFVRTILPIMYIFIHIAKVYVCISDFLL